MKWKNWLIALTALVLLAPLGCHWNGKEQAAEAPVLVEVPTSEWPVLGDDLSAASLHGACQESLAYLAKLPPDRMLDFGGRPLSVGDTMKMLTRLQDILWQYPDPQARTQALQRNFILLGSRGSDDQGRVLFTGYYEPILPARREPAAPFIHPLYAMPEDLVFIDLGRFGIKADKSRLVGQVVEHQVLPYPDREDIDYRQAIQGKAEILGYLADPVEAFFLHIQGSGQLQFGDGSHTRVGYAASNGRPYRSIGKLLLEDGLMNADEMSMQGIQKFLADHPQELRRVLSHNPSYVFFRTLPVEKGPPGCFEAPLTPGRSVALDRKVFPPATMAFITGQIPAGPAGVTPFSRFVLVQDTGGAIRGPGRLDLFFGSGTEAGTLAGRMKYPGRLYFFYPRQP